MSSLVIEEDVNAEPGHALLRLRGAGPGEDGRFRLIRRGAEAPNLGAHGWQAEPSLLTPLALRRCDEEVVLAVGPEVVDYLSMDDRVRVEAEGLGFAGEAYWPDVAPSPGGPATAYVTASRPASAPPEVAIPRRPPQAEEKGPRDQAGGAKPKQPDRLISMATTPAETPTPQPRPGLKEHGAGYVDEPTRGPIGSGKLPILPLVVACVVAAAAVGSYFAFLGDEDEPAAEDTAAIVAPEPCSAEVFEALRAGGAALAAWQEAAAGCLSADNNSAYVEALDLCVADGTPACLFQMARCYDPRHAAQLQCAPDEPSVAIAIDYYTRAQGAEVVGAADERADLCEQLMSENEEEAFLAGCG